MSFSLGFDIGAALLLTMLGVRGFYRGFVGEILSLLGIACGIFFASRFSSPVSDLLMQNFPSLDGSVAHIIAMSTVFFVVALIFGIISKIFRAVINFADLSLLNSLAGLLLGLGAGVLIIMFVYGALTLFAPTLGNGWIQDSIFMNLSAQMWPFFYGFIVSQGWIDPSKLLQGVPNI